MDHIETTMESLLPILIFVAIILFRVTAQQLGGKRKTVAAPPPVAPMPEESQPMMEALPESSPYRPVPFPSPAEPVAFPFSVEKEPSICQSATTGPRRPDARKTSSAIRLDTVRSARQAFIYSEIFRRKYE